MSFKIEHPPRALAVLASAALLLLWGVYTRTLSPAFPPDDSPETIAAAATLGIQHPPGYPLPALLGRVAVLAWPLGGAAWRVNQLSSLLACVAALLAAALAWRLTEMSPAALRAAAALLAGLSFGLWSTVWDQATEAKGGIYLLNLALGFGLWHAALSAWRGSPRGTQAFALLGGLSVAGHFMSAALWLLPLGMGLYYGYRKGKVACGRGVPYFLLPGLALYAYLPLRAFQWPMLDLGRPDTWAQFLWMLGRSGYSLAAVAGESGIAKAQVAVYWTSLWRSGAVGLPLLALLGAWSLWRTQRDAAKALVGCTLLALAAALLYNKTPADNRWLALIFALPGSALLAPLAGAGLAAAASCAPRFSGAFWLGLAVLLPFGAGAMHWKAADRSGSYVGYDYAHDLALGLPQGALYLGEGDYHVLPLIYLQAVEAKRLDVCVVLNALAGQPWYQQVLLHREPALILPELGDDGKAAKQLAVAEASRRPVVLGPYSAMLSAERLAPLVLRQRGLSRETDDAFGLPVPDVAVAWAARPPAREAADLEPVEAALLPWYAVALVQSGNEALDQRRGQDAIRDYRRALQRPGELPRAAIAYNLGQAWESVGGKDAARHAYQLAVQSDPNFAPAVQGLKALDKLTRDQVKPIVRQADDLAALGGHDAEALALYERAIHAGFETAILWRNVGVLFLRNGDPAQAIQAFTRGLALDPHDKLLNDYLAAAQGRATPKM